MRRAAAGLGLLAALSACTTGAVRQTRVAPLAPVGDVRAVRVSVVDAPEDVATELASGARVGLPRSGWRLANEGERAYAVELHVTSARQPERPEPSVGDDALAKLATFSGFRALDQGQLAVEATLKGPDGDAVLGVAKWQAAGHPGALAGSAGVDLGGALGQAMTRELDEWYPRRASDERLFFTPTARTLPKGAWSLSDDEALLLRAAFGLTRRLQLDLWLGGLPVPAFGGGALPLPGAMLAGGGGGGALFGLFDLGLKFVAVEETENVPGIALSYDLLDVYGAAIGAGGGVGIGGGGLGAGGFVGVAGANAQFNLLTLTVGKHFHTGTQLTLGSWLLDNHHFLPQSARFTAACGVAGASGTQSGAAMTTCAGGTPIDTLPIQVQPFLGVEQVFSEAWSAAVEVIPRWPLSQTMWTTGVRWQPGGDAPVGFLALDRVRARVDLALAWMVLDKNPDAGRNSATVAYFPWVGVGLYVW